MELARGGKGDIGREVFVSLRVRKTAGGGTGEDRTVPSLKSCSKGCSAELVVEIDDGSTGNIG